MMKIVLTAVFLPILTFASVYINETYEGGTLGGALASNLATVVSVGTNKVADINDNSASAASYLEYNAGSSAPGTMYISFDLLNINPTGTGTGVNPITFGVGLWNNTTGYKLNANSNRAFGIDIYHDGTTSTLKLRNNSTAVYTTTYNPAALMSFKIWVNDNDNSTLSYTRPDTGSPATLGADSYVVYLNNVLIGATAAGYTNQFSVSAGNAVLGRLGFYTASTTISDFQLDNLYVADQAPGAVASYTLTVNSGAGGGSYTNGAQVLITASNIAGKVFAQWTGDVAYVASETSSPTTVTMPTNAVTLTATYTDSTVYYLLTSSAGAHGMISPASTNVLSGGSANFVITADNHYRIATLTTNGTAVTGMSFGNSSTNASFTWSNVQAAGVLAATFVAQSTNTGAQIFSEQFEGTAIGSTPTGIVANVTVEDGTGKTGASHALHFLDASTNDGSYIEYNLSSSGKEYGALHISFDIYNNNAALMGTDKATVFGIGRYDASTSAKLGSSAVRLCDLSFYSGNGTLTQHDLRVSGGATTSTGSYTANTLYRIDIYLNDSNAANQNYTRPDTLATDVMAPNTIVVFANQTFIGSNVMRPAVDGGDASIGRIGFYSASTYLTDFYIDNLVVETLPLTTKLRLVILNGSL